MPGAESDEAVEVALATGDVEVEGRLPWSSNQTFLVAVGPAGDGGTVRRAVYKPERGERPLWDFPPGLYRREVAAYLLSRALGWDLVPPTVVRHDLPFGTGSLQAFEPADYDRHAFTLIEEGGHDEALQTICAFDVVVNNADRKSGHVLATDDGRLRAIDHGLCFHADHKLRTVLWEYCGEPVPDHLLADLDSLAGSLPASAPGLAHLLEEEEFAALVRRIARLVASGTFPEPAGDHPPYPWPMV
ncbi:MAG: SCO1664 family protein [Actinomycetota bacterium]|nr:SCO1664 family protein [Actinomycetota bacterium]